MTSWELLSPEENELRSLIGLHEVDGEIVSYDTDPERCAHLRAVILEKEREYDRRYEEEFGGPELNEPPFPMDQYEPPSIPGKKWESV